MDQSLLPLIAFTASSAMTPGPNNIMLMTSGVNFGFRRTVPHVLGVVFGFPAMVLVVGLGIGTTLLTQPLVHTCATVIGILYLLWLAWHIAAADVTANEAALIAAEQKADAPLVGSGYTTRSAARPMSFLGAAAFQWINAKAWISIIGMLAIYAPKGYGVVGGILVVTLINLVASAASATTWALFGLAVARWLQNPVRRRLFNIAMALLLVATLVPAIRDLMPA